MMHTGTIFQAVVNNIQTSLHDRTGSDTAFEGLEESLHLIAGLDVACLYVFDHGGCGCVDTIGHQVCDLGEPEGLLDKEEELFDAVGCLTAYSVMNN